MRNLLFEDLYVFIAFRELLLNESLMAYLTGRSFGLFSLALLTITMDF